MKKDRLNEIMEFSNQIYEELLELEKRKNEVKSDIIKELLMKNYNIAANTFTRLPEVVELLNKYLEKSLEYSKNFNENSINSAKQILENIKKQSKMIDEIKFEDIRSFTKISLEYQGQMGIEIIQSAETMSKINELMEFMTIETVYLSFYNCYLPYTINDYNKYVIIRDSIKNTIKAIAGLIPILSPLLAAFDILKNSKLIYDASNNENLQEEFFKGIDNDISKLETQTNMLMLAYSNQQDVINYLKTINLETEERIQELNNPIDCDECFEDFK